MNIKVKCLLVGVPNHNDDNNNTGCKYTYTKYTEPPHFWQRYFGQVSTKKQVLRHKRLANHNEPTPASPSFITG